MAVRRGKGWGWLLLVLFVAAAAAAVWFYRFDRGQQNRPVFRLGRVERGPIANTVSSTGTLSAVITVQVGSQVSGQIKELLADYNSEVKAGQVIARIDPVNFEARVRQAEAELGVARANVVIQRASVERARAEHLNAQAALQAAAAQTRKASVAVEDAGRVLERKKRLRKGSIISESEIDEARALYDQALAQLKTVEAEQEAQASLVNSRQAALDMTQAQVKHALAQVKQHEAALHQNQVDLEHTIIRSPVDGVVIERNVDIGQTVAASLQAPTLFTIAQDLRKMQVDTSLDEADIGQVKEGQEATFTVDAFPEKEFRGEVVQIRKAPLVVQNVVTYTVVVSVGNDDLRLLPGMTANVQIFVDKRNEALKVPNAALRFQPPGDQAGPGQAMDEGGGELQAGGRGPQQAADRLRRLTEALELSENQQARIRSIFSGVREKVIALRRQGAAPDEIRSQVQTLREQSRGAMMAVLNPEQQKKFRVLSARRSTNLLKKGRVWIPTAEGKSKPLEIITGISDGSFTEVVRGDLQEGQQVIIGILQPSRKRTSTPGRGRFGF